MHNGNSVSLVFFLLILKYIQSLKRVATLENETENVNLETWILTFVPLLSDGIYHTQQHIEITRVNVS